MLDASVSAKPEDLWQGKGDGRKARVQLTVHAEGNAPHDARLVVRKEDFDENKRGRARGGKGSSPVPLQRTAVTVAKKAA